MPAHRHILLLRHGQTASNAGGICQGHLPVPLDELGHRQAASLAARLPSFVPRVGVLVSSDLVRAEQTARPVAAALKLPVAFEPLWRERSMGQMEGKTVGERGMWALASGDETPPGGESKAAFTDRVLAAVAALPDPPAADVAVAVVTHGGPIRVFLQALATGRLKAAPGFAVAAVPDVIGNCSILHAVHDVAADAWRVACVNDVAHLASPATAGDAG